MKGLKEFLKGMAHNALNSPVITRCEVTSYAVVDMDDGNYHLQPTSAFCQMQEEDEAYSTTCLYHGVELCILEQSLGGNMLFITIPWDREQLGRFLLLPLVLFAP